MCENILSGEMYQEEEESRVREEVSSPGLSGNMSLGSLFSM